MMFSLEELKFIFHWLNIPCNVQDHPFFYDLREKILKEIYEKERKENGY